MKAQKSRKTAVLNVLGSFGYFACLLQWLWTAMILMPAIINSSFYRHWFPTSMTNPEPSVVQATVSTGSVPGLVSVLGVVLGSLIVFGALYVMVVKFPRSVAETGEKVTHTVAAAITPIVIEHTHLPVKQRREVPDVVIVIMKLLLVFAPLCLLLFAQGLTLAMSFEIIMVIGIALFSWSFILFALQFMLSRLLHVEYKTLR